MAIYEKVLGHEHRYTARIMTNLAVVLRDQGGLRGRGPLLECALVLLQKLAPD